MYNHSSVRFEIRYQFSQKSMQIQNYTEITEICSLKDLIRHLFEVLFEHEFLGKHTGYKYTCIVHPLNTQYSAGDLSKRVIKRGVLLSEMQLSGVHCIRIYCIYVLILFRIIIFYQSF